MAVLLALLLCGMLSCAGAASAQTCQTGVTGEPGTATTFSACDGEQSYDLPAGTTEVRITAIGAAGAGVYSGVGGEGGEATATVDVSGDSTLYVEVGSSDGWNGGGGNNGYGADGGGGSDVRTVSCATDCPGAVGSGTLDSRLLVAGGGGGAGGCNVNGGNGGAVQDGNGADGDSGGLCGDDTNTPAGGGTQSAGGPASSGCGNSGDEGSGGTATDQSGGGGGGYYGGGSGCGGEGGGGGSSWAESSATHTSFSTTSDAASVTITPIANSNPAASTTSVSSSENPSAYGDSVTFTATVSPESGSGIPTGGVEFEADGTAISGCSSLSLQTVSGQQQATCTTSALTVAGSPHTIEAIYFGDGNYTGSTGSLDDGQTVDKADSSTSVSSSENPSTYGDSVTFTATVSPDSGSGTPTGEVKFEADGTIISNCSSVSLQTVSVSGSDEQQATCTTSALTATSNGSAHAIKVIYSGDGDYNSSNDTMSGGQTVNQADATTTVSSSQNPSTYGESVTFTATVAPETGSGTPTGTVDFTAGGDTICSDVALTTVSVSGTDEQQATCATSTLGATALPDDVYAVYSGDPNYESGEPGALQGGQAVDQAPTSVATPSSSANPAISGHSIAFSTTVTNTGSSAAIDGGTVTFSSGSTTLCTSGTVGATGAASCSATLAAGTYDVTATYGGDDDFAASAPSSTLEQTVDAPGAPSATISSPAGGGTYTLGQKVETTFSCHESSDGPGLRSCDDSTGTKTTAGGHGHLDTATAGTGHYSVTATSSDGQVNTTTISYTVLPSNDVTLVSIRGEKSGVVKLKLKVPGAGRIAVVESDGKTAVARKDASPKGAGTVSLSIKQNAAGHKLLRKHHSGFRVLLKITYTPTGGHSRKITTHVHIG